MVYLNITPEIEVFYMLFERSLSNFSLTSLKKHIQYLNFQSNIKLDHPVDGLLIVYSTLKLLRYVKRRKTLFSCDTFEGDDEDDFDEGKAVGRLLLALEVGDLGFAEGAGMADFVEALCDGSTIFLMSFFCFSASISSYLNGIENLLELVQTASGSKSFDYSGWGHWEVFQVNSRCLWATKDQTGNIR